MSISKMLAKRVTNYQSPQSLGARFRAKRIAPLLRVIEAFSQAHGRVDIIDIGGTDTYWRIVPLQYLEKHNVKITIVNLPGTNLSENYGPFTFTHGDGCNLSAFKDGTFHIAHSNSVIEHVGDWDRMVRFSAEFKRIAQKYFIQTPNYWFPVEPHCLTPFFHWLPKPVRVWLVMHFSLGHWRKAASVDDAVRIVESARLLDKKMFQALFLDAEIRTEWFLLLPKSFIATRE